MEQKWWIFLIIGLILGAVLGYAASEQGLFKKQVVGRVSVWYQCTSNGGVTDGGYCGASTCYSAIRNCIDNGGTFEVILVRNVS